MVSATVIYAATSIESNELPVTITEASLTISGNSTGSTIDTLFYSGTLSGVSLVDDIPISFQVKEGSGSYVEVNATTTDVNGDFIVTWNPSTAGSYTVKAIATLPTP